MQRRIDGALGQVQRALASALELVDDGVAVQGAVGEDGENQGVEVALEGFCSQTSPC
jgi:hypothetical protein